MNTFSELNLSPVLKANLAKNLFVEPTAVQSESIPPALAGSDIVATAQTGTGKTLAFLIPLIERLIQRPSSGIDAIVLTPTRELAIQIERAFALLAVGTKVRAAIVVGGMNENTQLKAIRAGVQVLIATPGRLCDFLNRKLVKLGGAGLLVLDEADRMLDMGFLPAIQSITSALPSARQNLLFSATFEPSVKHLIERYCHNPVRVEIGSPTKPAENVDLHLYEVEQDRKLGLLQKLLREEQGSCLVFARTKHGAGRLAKKLSAGGIRATCIHGDRTQNQRNEALKSFQQGHHRVLVATDVASRGIHVEGIGHVVNYDIPRAPEDFIHRVGRTGRLGAPGTASTFASASERGDVRKIERALSLRLTRREVGDDVPREAKRPANVIVLPAKQAAAVTGKRGKGYSFKPGMRRRGGR